MKLNSIVIHTKWHLKGGLSNPKCYQNLTPTPSVDMKPLFDNLLCSAAVCFRYFVILNYWSQFLLVVLNILIILWLMYMGKSR